MKNIVIPISNNHEALIKLSIKSLSDEQKADAIIKEMDKMDSVEIDLNNLCEKDDISSLIIALGLNAAGVIAKKLNI